VTGVAFLALAVIFSSGVAMSMKVANIRGLNFGQFLAVNYSVCILWLLSRGALHAQGLDSPLLWCLGLFIGVMYVLSLWLFDRSIAATGLALSTTLMRLSSTLPTLGSLLIFGEQLSGFQVAGILLAFSCLPLAGKEPLRFDGTGKKMLKGIIWGLLLFLVYGLTDFMFKVQAELSPLANPNGFIAIIFGTALCITFPLLFKGKRPGRDCIFWGCILGSTNVLATHFWIFTLAHLPGSIAYPSLGLGVISVTTFASLLFFRETIRPANYVFLILSAAAVCLINLG